MDYKVFKQINDRAKKQGQQCVRIENDVINSKDSVVNINGKAYKISNIVTSIINGKGCLSNPSKLSNWDFSQIANVKNNTSNTRVKEKAQVKTKLPKYVEALNNKVFTVTETEAYMGEKGFKGNNSSKGLRGTDLTTELRRVFKEYGIKGTSVRCEDYDSIYVKVKYTMVDLLPLEEYIKIYDYKKLPHFFMDESGTEYSRDDFYSLTDAKEQKELLKSVAKVSYKEFIKSEKEVRDYSIFKKEFQQKLLFIKAVLDSYNYNNSNAMVDYFDRGFFEHIVVAPQKG